jgi:tRNA (cmo5U34)-methyltransferase
MNHDELESAFDQQAAGYDKQWAKLSPIREGLHFLLESVFAQMPPDARVLCVGVGTGAELSHLARHFPRWSFTAVEPSGAMLEICRQRATAEGFASRCHFHEGYVDSTPLTQHDAATSFLVSQFLLDRGARVEYFRSIAMRLRPGGLLATSDLASAVDSPEYEALVRAWLSMMAAAGLPPENLEKMRAAWKKDVAILPPAEVASIIASAGFEPPTQFYQAGLIHAWFARRAADPAHGTL